MKKTFFVVSLIVLGSTAFGKTETNSTSTQTVELTDEQLFTSVKPADGAPAVFATQEELNAKQGFKIENTKQKLMENRNNPEMVRFLQEELWRFENAVVHTQN